jgi:hypothetical protein
MNSIMEEVEEANHRFRVRQMRERILESLVIAADLAARRERNLCRPSVILRPQLAETQCVVTGRPLWAAMLDGLICCGSTPEEAYSVFDEVWMRGLAE